LFRIREEKGDPEIIISTKIFSFDKKTTTTKTVWKEEI
jgi:hypothetical protein